MKILFFGNLSNQFQKGWQRFNTLKQLGVEVVPFDFSPYQSISRLDYWLVSLTGGQYRTANIVQLNQIVLEQCQKHRPEAVWIEKTWFLWPQTLAELRRRNPDVKLVSYQTDNPFGKRPKEFWQLFIRCIPAYDICFVMRDEDVVNFDRAGARRVVLSHYGFYPELMHPHSLNDIPSQLRHDVVFIGTAMDHRVRAITDLLEADIPLHIYGNSWEKQAAFRRFPAAFHRPTNEEYALIVCGSKISLGYVSSSNVDVYTERSVDIPAAGGFFLAERTAKHQTLYHEGVEAEFFASSSECIDKIRFYLTHEPERARIAHAGYERCLKSDYSLKRFMREAVHHIQSL